MPKRVREGKQSRGLQSSSGKTCVVLISASQQALSSLMSKNPEEQEDQSEACKLNSVELFPKTTYAQRC